MTQAPATPEFGDIVENGWASEENPTRKGYFVRSFKRIGRMNPGLTWEVTDRAGRFWEVQPRIIGDRLTVTPQADALEAQQARIAELEGLFADVNALCTEINTRWEASQALAARYEKALAYIAENDRSYLVAPTPGAKGYPGHYGHVARQALSSSQGRHEGVTSGFIPELPGVNAVPLPASPDGPSQMDRVWAAVNVLGAPDTACTSDEDRAYCRAIGDALSEIEKLGGRPQ